jgi:hypothetical protein
MILTQLCTFLCSDCWIGRKNVQSRVYTGDTSNGPILEIWSRLRRLNPGVLAQSKFQFIDRAGYKWEKLANGDEMKNKNVLISGSGIAGLTLAYWLKHYGFTPTLIEKHPTLRTGGYKIDIRGVAMEVVRRMGAYVPYLRRGPLSKAPQLWTVLASH